MNYGGRREESGGEDGRHRPRAPEPRAGSEKHRAVESRAAGPRAGSEKDRAAGDGRRVMGGG